MVPRSFGGVLLAGIAVAIAACSPPQTGIVIRIDSDLVRGVELASVHVRVVREREMMTVLDRSYDLTAPQFPLPGTVVLDASNPDDARPLHVVVNGNLAGGGSIDKDYNVGFRTGRLLLLDVYLARRCAPPSPPSCDAGYTCGPCGCDPVDPGALFDYSQSSGTNPQAACVGRDAGTGDGSMDCVPEPETCNGIDDDCNGAIDDGLDSESCGVGACMRTVPSCVAGAPVRCVPDVPTAERCNGLDDDCDGNVDNGTVCPSGQSCKEIINLDNEFACCGQISPSIPCPTSCSFCAVNVAGTRFCCHSTH